MGDRHGDMRQGDRDTVRQGDGRQAGKRETGRVMGDRHKDMRQEVLKTGRMDTGRHVTWRQRDGRCDGGTESPFCLEPEP